MLTLIEPSEKSSVEVSNPHYWEKFDSYMVNKRAETMGQISEEFFEEIFRDFEKNYFTTNGPMAMMTTEAISPIHLRMVQAMVRYTK